MNLFTKAGSVKLQNEVKELKAQLEAKDKQIQLLNALTLNDNSKQINITELTDNQDRIIKELNSKHLKDLESLKASYNKQVTDLQNQIETERKSIDKKANAKAANILAATGLGYDVDIPAEPIVNDTYKQCVKTIVNNQ